MIKIGRILLATALMLTGCIDFDDATQTVSVKVQVELPRELSAADLSGHTVTMTNNGQTFSTTTDANGIATFVNIIPDVYDVATSWKITSEEYTNITGEFVTNGKYTISGSLGAQMIAQEHTLQLATNVSRDQSLIIGKVYFAGSKDINNKNYIAGKYIEIYNNSDEAQSISGLYIALLESESTVAYTPGQVPDTVFAKQVFQVPAGDTTTMLEPGGTLLLVNSAIDHSGNGSLERNLLNADYEAKDVKGKTTNNPDTPALTLIYSAYAAISYMNMAQGGPCSIVIFTTDEDAKNWPLAYAYGKTKGNRFMKIPTSSIIDGVEILQNKSQTGVDINTKRLFNYIDAGYININATNGYNGEVVYRKTEQTTDSGRKILMDTNNSQSDFDVTTDINPREYK